VNRISLGVQVFDKDLLTNIGRAHSLEDAYSALNHFKDAGVINFSIDLISGLPNQSIESWEKSLLKALEFQPAHISTYDLMIEDATSFSKWGMTPGQKPLPTIQETAEMYKMASRILKQHGYTHYELSNYAKPGFECSHNLVYWNNQPFAAFGMGAASYLQGKRITRPRTLNEYLSFVNALAGPAVAQQLNEKKKKKNITDNGYLVWIKALERYADSDSLPSTPPPPTAPAPAAPAAAAAAAPAIGEEEKEEEEEEKEKEEEKEEEEDDQHQHRASSISSSSISSSSMVEEVTDSVMLGLRLKDGLSLSLVRERFGTDVMDKILKGAIGAVSAGLAVIERDPHTNQPTRLRLTDPDGFLVSSDVITSIFAEFNR